MFCRRSTRTTVLDGGCSGKSRSWPSVFGRLMVSRVIRLGHPTPFTDHKTGESDIGPSLGPALPTFTMSPVAFLGSGSAAPQRGVSGRHGVRIAYGTSNCPPSLPFRPFCAPTWPPTWYRPAWCRAAVPCGRCRCLWSPAVPTRRRHRNAARLSRWLPRLDSGQVTKPVTVTATARLGRASPCRKATRRKKWSREWAISAFKFVPEQLAVQLTFVCAVGSGRGGGRQVNQSHDNDTQTSSLRFETRLAFLLLPVPLHMHLCPSPLLPPCSRLPSRWRSLMVLGIGSTYGAYSAITAATDPPTGTHYPMTMPQQSAVSSQPPTDGRLGNICGRSGEAESRATAAL